MLERIRLSIERKMAKNDALIKQMPDYIGREQDTQEGKGQPPSPQSQGMSATQQVPTSPLPSSPTPDQNTVRVISPDGVPGMMSKDAFMKAVQSGKGYRLA